MGVGMAGQGIRSLALKRLEMLSNDELRSFLQLVQVGVARGGCGYMGRGVVRGLLTDSEEAGADGCGQGWVWLDRGMVGVVRQAGQRCGQGVGSRGQCLGVGP